MSQPFFRRFRRRKSGQWPLNDEFNAPNIPPKIPEKDFNREDNRTPTLDLDGGMFDGINGSSKYGPTRPGKYDGPDDVGTVSSLASPPPTIRGGSGGGVRSPVQQEYSTPRESTSKVNHSSALEYQPSIDSAVDSGTATASTVSSTASPNTALRGRSAGSNGAFTHSPSSHGPSSNSGSGGGSQSRGGPNQFRATTLKQPSSRRFNHLSQEDGEGNDEFGYAMGPKSSSSASNSASRRFHHPSTSSQGKEQLDEFDAPEHPGEAMDPVEGAYQPRSEADARIGKAIQDRVAVVTGCSSGIGLCSSLAFLDSGWCVLGVDIQLPPKELDESPAFHFFQHDVTSKEAPKFIFESAKDRFNGRIDALCNIAGCVDTLKCVDTLDMDEWNWVMDTNLTAPVRLMGAAVKVFDEQQAGGSIVNIGSYASISGGVGGVAHTASKHGLVGATKNTAFRFKKHNFRCNILCPGAVRSNIRDAVDPRETDYEAAEVFKTVREAAHPAELRLQPEQVAGMVVFLASSASKGINGAVIPIDNGWSTI